MTDRKVYMQEYHRKNKDKLKEYGQKYYKKNKDKLREQHKAYYQTHKEQMKDYYQTHKGQMKDYYQTHKEQIKEKQKANRHRYKREYYRRTRDAENSHCIWTVWEIDLVMRHEITDTELAKKIGRSVTAVQNMRCRMKKVNEVGL